MVDYTLLITTIGHLVSSFLMGLTGLLVLLQNPRRKLNILFCISVCSATVFGTSLAIGINLDPTPLAYFVWMFNLVDIVLAATFLHFIFTFVGKDKTARWFVWGMYAIGGTIIAWSLIAPHLFLPSITPKLFTKSYLNPGPLYTAMVIYFFVAIGTAFATLILSYLSDPKKRTKLEYFIVALVTGFSIGPLDFFLVYDIPVSPVLGIFFFVYMVPIAYGIFADELLDIRIVFKRALVYSTIIGLITGFLMFLISFNNYLAARVAWITWWTTPIITAVVATFIGRLYWLKSVENEREKYEFITVAAHKLRTPLTQISWGIRELSDQTKDDETLKLAQHIQHSTNRLIELTNIIFETTENNSVSFSYLKDKVGLLATTRAVLEQFNAISARKNLKVSILTGDEQYVLADERRIRSVIEVFIENAMSYTPEGGSVTIDIALKKNDIVYSVQDSGIGITPKDKHLIFSRFYRSDAAKRADTEGVGLGLAMAKNIIEKHGGKIGIESEGEGKGSTFWFSLPAT